MQQYSEGQQLQGSDGNVYVVSGGVPRLAPAGNATASTAPTPSTIQGNPKQPAPQTPDQARYDQSNANYKDYQSESQPIYDRTNAIDKVRDGYRQDKRVLKYEQAEPVYISGLQSQGNPAGDLLLVNAFSKVNDPDTGVQQREGDQAASAQPATEQIKARLLKQFGDDGYGNFTPEGRQRMREAMTVRMRQLADQYRQARSDHSAYIKDLNIPNADPETIIGPFAGLPFQQAEAQYLGREPGLNVPVSREYAASIAGTRNEDNALYQALEQEYRAQGIEFGYAPDGKPVPTRGGGAADPNVEAFKAGVGDLVEGAGDVVGLVGNPLNAGINWLAGTNLSTDLGQSARDATGLPEGDPLASAIDKGGVAALSGAGIARAVPGALAETLASQPVQQIIGGAASGGATELGRQNGLGPIGQAAVGIGAGGLAFGGSNALAGMANRVGGAPNELAQIAKRQGVDLLPADVGGPVAKRVTGAAAQAPFSASAVVKGASKAQDQIGEAATRAARREGAVLAPDEAGEAVQKAGLNYAPKQAQKIGRVYDRAEERAKGVTIKPVGALQLLDEQITRLGQTGEMAAPLLKDLQSIRRSIANGVSVAGMRDVRTLLSQGTFNGKIRSSMEKGIYKQVIGAVSQDIENGLRAAGRKDALNLFKIADKAWSERIDHIDSILEPVIGRGKSGEDILAAVEGMAKGKSGGVRRLSGLLSELPAEEAQNVRATITDRLGKATAGQQDDTGEQFSASTFLTRWSAMSAKGKSALFGDSELRRNLDEIAKLASATKQTGKYANTSNTVGGIVSNAGILASIGFNSPSTAAIAGTTQFLTGQLMASKAFTGWLARMPRNPAAQAHYADKLKQIAVNEPIIANDLTSIQNFLRSPQTRAAAGSEDQKQERR